MCLGSNKMCLSNTKNILFGQMGSQGKKSTACNKDMSLIESQANLGLG
jgi:hypothetical protein